MLGGGGGASQTILFPAKMAHKISHYYTIYGVSPQGGKSHILLQLG